MDTILLVLIILITGLFLFLVHCYSYGWYYKYTIWPEKLTYDGKTFLKYRPEQYPPMYKESNWVMFTIDDGVLWLIEYPPRRLFRKQPNLVVRYKNYQTKEETELVTTTEHFKISLL
jgi:hypothetical protein